MEELPMTHAAVLMLFWTFPGWAARRDAALFAANPASDDYHVVFHRQRLLERIGIALALLIVGSRAAWPLGWLPALVSTAGLAAAGTAFWTYRFNRVLSLARHLPEYYVSADPRAALFPDRWLYRRAVARVPAGKWSAAELSGVIAATAAAELRRLQRVVLVAGILAEVAGLLYLWS